MSTLTEADMARARDLFAAALARQTKLEISLAIGCSRTAVSLVANDKYPSRTDAFFARVLAVYDRYECPHTGEPTTKARCDPLANEGAPTSSPRGMRQWRACQTCPHKPEKKS